MPESGDAPGSMVEAIHDLEDPLLTRDQCEAILLAAGVPSLLARAEAAEADRDRLADQLRECDAALTTVEAAAVAAQVDRDGWVRSATLAACELQELRAKVDAPMVEAINSVLSVLAGGEREGE